MFRESLRQGKERTREIWISPLEQSPWFRQYPNQPGSHCQEELATTSPNTSDSTEVVYLNVHTLIKRETVGSSASLFQHSIRFSPPIAPGQNSVVASVQQQLSSWDKIEAAVTPRQKDAASREAAWTLSNSGSTADSTADSTIDFFTLMPAHLCFLDEFEFVGDPFEPL